MDAYAQPIGVQTVAVAVYLHTIPVASRPIVRGTK
jgi:hypothetical protein